MQTEVSREDRAKLLGWLARVHFEFKVSTQSFQLAVSMIDRFLARQHVKIGSFMLVGITAMFIACKFEEQFPPQITDFAQVTRDFYSKEQLLQMEVQILKVLEFEVSAITPNAMLESYSLASLCHDDAAVRMTASYLVDLATLDADGLEFKPSLLAVAALTLALQTHCANEHPGLDQTTPSTGKFNSNSGNFLRASLCTQTRQPL